MNGVHSLAWPRFTWQLYWNYQGAAAYGTLTTGAWAYPYQKGPTQTACPNIGSTSLERCVLFQWPRMKSAYDQNRGEVYFPAWHGTLIENKRDASGLEYKRSRVYDPQTGRFTQEDPIGLGGGLNVYGFAKSDPVNLADPFGNKVVFIGKAAQVFWERLVALARMASASPDERIAEAGRRLGATLAAIEASTRITVTIKTIERGRLSAWWNYGFQGVPWASTDCRTQRGYCDLTFDTRYGPAHGVNNDVVLGHEVGHVDAWLAFPDDPGQNESDTRAVQMENRVRLIYGCAVRPSHAVEATKVRCR